MREGRERLDRALALGGRGQYLVQAALADLHAEAHPDWPQIAALYGELARLTGSPVVALNEAAAIAEAGDAEAGLALVGTLKLDSYPYTHSVRGELLSRLGRIDEALIAFERALELVTAEPERRMLERRAAELRSPDGSQPRK